MVTETKERENQLCQLNVQVSQASHQVLDAKEGLLLSLGEQEVLRVEMTNLREQEQHLKSSLAHLQESETALLAEMSQKQRMVQTHECIFTQAHIRTKMISMLQLECGVVFASEDTYW